MPVGTISYTPESQALYKLKKEENIKRQLRRCNTELGNFYFMPTTEQFDNVSSETAIRLIYLNTYTKHNSNLLMLTERTPLKKSDLPRILGVSKSTAFRFWKEVSPRFLTENENGLLLTNTSVFKRGKIKTNSEHTYYQKIYVKGVRKLYQAASNSSHKQLGYLFKLLPFINIEYNLLCFNPLETNIEKIELLSMADFCSLINYDITHLDRLLWVYRNTFFEVGENKESFCAITYDGINRKNAKIFINPHILYSGTDYKRVEVLGAFCKLQPFKIP